MGTGEGRQDSRPGSEGTLLGLYRDVPAAEEYDLVEQTDIDEHQKRYAAWLATQDDVDEPDDELEVDEPEEEPLTTGQTIGMIEHLLDAEVIDDAEGPDDPG